MVEDEIMVKIKKYLEALEKAEEEGKQQFDCPLCGGKAWWTRSEYNGHRHSCCASCGFYVGE